MKLQKIINWIRAKHHAMKSFNLFYHVWLLVAVVFFWLTGNILNQVELSDDKSVLINVELKTEHDDRFNLYYMPIEEEIHHESRNLAWEASKSINFQTLSFVLPDTIKIKQLRFDLGVYSIHQKIEIRKIYVHYNKNTLVLFDPSSNINYFKVNEFVELKEQQQFFLTKMPDGTYDPFIFSANITSEYQNILNSKNRLPAPWLIAFVLTAALLTYLIFFLEVKDFMNLFYSLASSAFIIILLLPQFNQTFYVGATENSEKRVLANKPVFNGSDLADYAKKFEAYYNDNFAFRELLVSWGSKIKYWVFHSSAVTKAAVGKKGWLFLNGEFYEITGDLQKTNLYTPSQLKISAETWENRFSELAGQNISYFMATWPDKHYIYPEFLPLSMALLNKDTICRGNQAIEYLQKRQSPVQILDVKEKLLQEKLNQAVYEKYDSHWNAYGAFIAYQELMNVFEKKFPQLKAHSIEDYLVTWSEQKEGDLSEMLGLKLSEIGPNFELKNDSSEVESISVQGFPKKTFIYENRKASSDITILIYRDSFTNALIPFLKPHFKKIILIWDEPYSFEFVKSMQPQLVLECYASRYFR